jgi:hypothetical protein
VDVQRCGCGCCAAGEVCVAGRCMNNVPVP